MPEDAEELDLCDLVDACRAGDQSAWARLVSELSPLVYSIPRRSGFSQEEAEDVVQSVFALLVRKLDSIEDPQALPKWLSVTTQRACWRELRSGNARRLREASTARPDAYEEVQTVAQQEKGAEALRIALSALGNRCERLLRALFSDGRSRSPVYGEISEATGMPVGSIGPTRARCLKKLSRILAEDPCGRELLEAFGPPAPESEEA